MPETLSPKSVIPQVAPQLLPMSGSEPAFDPGMYSHGDMCRRHNCLAYALDIARPKKSMYLQILSNLGGSDEVLRLSRGLTGKPQKTRQCLLTELFFHRQFADTYRVQPDKSCKHGFYKIAILNSAPRASHGRSRHYDFHFVRQNSNGMWSHKRGGTKITRENARGKPIHDPRLANFDYGDLKYKPCSFFCVKSKATRRPKS